MLSRSEIINRCKSKGACKPQFDRLLRATSDLDFWVVLLDNRNWCYDKDIYRYHDIPETFRHLCKYDDIRDFSEGLAAVSLSDAEGNDVEGYIDRKGVEVIEPKYFRCDNFLNGTAFVTTAQSPEDLISIPNPLPLEERT